MTSVIPQAVAIGRVIETARHAQGYSSRASLVETKKLRNKLTQEGLRKIEKGERVPRLENIKLLAEVLSIPSRGVKELERLALEANVARVTRRAGNATVSFEIEGHAVKVLSLPPKRKTEVFVREVVTELTEMVCRYGVLEADVDHFRRFARSALLKRLT